LANSISTTSHIDKDVVLTECAPKLIYHLKEWSSEKIAKLSPSAKEFLDTCLRKKTEQTSDALKEKILKYFPDRDCTFLSDVNKNSEVEEWRYKILKDSNPKNLRGKKLNGFALANFIEEWANAINSGSTPNINNIWDIIIKKDVDEFYSHALKIFNENVSKINEAMEQEDIVKQLYQFKLESMMLYNQIFNFNQDTFNNSEYMSWYNNSKRNLEVEIAEIESKVFDHNLNKSFILCQKFIQHYYGKIKERLNNNYYNSKNCDEYIKDFEEFMKLYNQKAKGPVKMKIFVDFLSENKPEMIKTFCQVLEAENKIKIEEGMKRLKESTAKKSEAEDRNRQLTELTETNSKRVII
jgi:hypothetical protein